MEPSAQQESDTACDQPLLYVLEAQPDPGQGISAPERLCSCLEYLRSIDLLEDIVSSVIINIYSDEDLHTRLSSPTQSDTAVDLIDEVLKELKISPDIVLHGNLFVPESYKCEVAQSVHRELLSYSGSQESLQQALSTSKDDVVKKIASSISLEVSKVASRIGTPNLHDAPPSPAPRGDTDDSTVTCPASDISKDIVLIVLAMVPFNRSSEAKWIGLQGHTEMTRGLLDAVMVELLSSPVMLTLPFSVARRWHQPSLEELNGAARQIYKKMMDQCGSEEALESALRLQNKLVNAALANLVADEVLQIFSNEEFSSAATHDRATDMDDFSVADQPPSFPSHSLCTVNCKAMWEIIYRLLQKLCPKMLMDAQLIRYSQEYFYSALEPLFRCEELKVCWNKTVCVACQDPRATDFITSRVLQGSQERMGCEARLGVSLDLQDKAVVRCIVDLTVEETLLFMSHHHDISIPAAVLLAKDDALPPGKQDGDWNEVSRKGLLSATRGCLNTASTLVNSEVQFYKRGPHVLSGKLQKHSRRGHFITLEGRNRQLAEPAMTCDSQTSDTPNTDTTSSSTYRSTPRTKEILINQQVVKLKYCFTFKMFRPSQTSHCSLWDKCVGKKGVDPAMEWLFGGLPHWDEEHFLFIAEKDYWYEYNFTFFLLLPVVLRGMAETLWPLGGWLTMRECLLLAVALGNNALFLLSMVALFALGRVVLQDRLLALMSSLLYCFPL